MALHRHVAHADEQLRADPLVPDLPRLRMPEDTTSPEIAERLVRGALILDGNARLNLATFVTTWMEAEAQSLMAATFDKNMIDKDEYPQTAELERRCVNILADLWHADAGDHATGTSTTGSSEAAMLAGMALLWRWRERRRNAGEPVDRPNLVTGINVQVCWEKFCRYWASSRGWRPWTAIAAILTAGRRPGSATRTQSASSPSSAARSTAATSRSRVSLRPSTLSSGSEASISRCHVDAASGGFVAPFLQPDLRWDFRLPRVQSINASGHKYGLVYPGIGWALWRDAAALPEDLVFRVNYLGGDMPTFALNFSRPGSQVVAQYYNFVRLGRAGYRAVQQRSQDIARRLADGIADIGPFELLTDGGDLPVFAFKLRDEVTNYTVFEVSRALRERGWQVPAYTLPANLEHIAVLRIVVRVGLNTDMADVLLHDLRRAVEEDLSKLPAPPPISRPRAFHH